VQASGGTAPYTYILVGSGITNTTGTFTGLSAGTYIVQVRDASNPSGCGEIQVTLSQPDSLKLQSSITKPVTCQGGSDGEIQVTLTGGTPPYTYTWQTLSGTPLPASGSTLSNLSEGTYLLIATDNNGCR
jgi:hypothetical protein